MLRQPVLDTLLDTQLRLNRGLKVLAGSASPQCCCTPPLAVDWPDCNDCNLLDLLLNMPPAEMLRLLMILCKLKPLLKLLRMPDGF